MHNNQSSYSRWSWIIAFILAIILLLMYLTGKGPSDACCAVETVSAPTAEVMPTEALPTVTEAFNFSATETDFTSNGSVSSITWFSDLDALKALLSGNFSVEGDDSTVAITGSVDSEDDKQKKGNDAQAFFGPDVMIDNQITVVMTEPVDVPPTTAKLYFDSGFHRLPDDGLSTLEPFISWLKNHPEAIAVISGYHDATGDLASNQKLAKKRAQSTFNALLAGGIATDRIEMRKPESTEGNGDLSEARRVEVSIK